MQPITRESANEQKQTAGDQGAGKKKAKVRGMFKHELTDEQKAEIKEAFDLFDSN